MIDSERIKLFLENYKHLKITTKSILHFDISALWRSVAALQQAVHLKQFTHVKQSSSCRMNVKYRCSIHRCIYILHISSSSHICRENRQAASTHFGKHVALFFDICNCCDLNEIIVLNNWQDPSKIRNGEY